MNWFESLFGFSPDGGSGATEALYGIACAVAILLFVARRRRIRARDHAR